MSDRSAVTTFLFTDIEGSTRLWEQEPSRMPPALARHDALAQAAVGRHRGIVVKMIGDGMHAAFDDPLDAVLAILELQRALADPAATEGLPLRIRAGLHAGVVERRDNDYFGTAVNRAARIMGSAHGGQVLVSGTVAGLVASRLPAAVALRDLGAVRLRDLAGAEHVFQLLHQELRADFPALRSLAATPNNLPQQMTTFVGREREIADLCALLGTARLLTLTGMGGLGKTRLALEVAVRALEDHADGVWFVELASLSDPARVPQAVASALGVSEEGARSVMDSLLQFVADRSLLVVLDNCEHLVGACAELATRLLQAGAGVRVLATSRENLHVRGETTYPVPALSVPEAGREMAPEAMVHCDAVRLFIDRALAAQPLFRLTADNAAAVTEICRRLDGIPLALELAAARLRALPVEGIATRLQDRFRLLVAGDRTALPRQKTLRALIDWSHDLLTEAERIVFRRLAVFAGGFNLEAAEAVVPGSDVADGDVLDLLSQLVDKSLVAVAADSGRYRLLETVRQYAGECLAGTGDGAALRARHLAHYVALAERARPELVGPHQAEWLARLDLDRENLLLAHAGCAGDPQAGATGLQLVTALKQYFYRRGLLGLAQQVMAEALVHPGAQVRDAERSRALFSIGQICLFAGRYPEALGFLEECLAIARETGDRRRVASVLQPLGAVLSAQGDLAGARRCHDEAIVLAREFGSRRDVAAAINNRAQLHRLEGELAAAQPLYRDVLAMVRGEGDREGVAIALLNLAMLEIARGAAAPAASLLAEALAIAVETGSRPASQCVVDVAAGLATLRGDLERAARLHGAAAAQAAETGLQRDPADEAFLAPLIARAQYRPAGGSLRGCRGCRPRTLARRDARGCARLARTRYPAAACSRRRLIAGRRYSFIICGSMT